MNKLKYYLKTLEGIIKILIQSRKSSVTAKRHSDQLVILGNGPSLKVDKEKIKIFTKNKDILAVNYFALSDEFIEFRPNFYVINASEFWIKNMDPKSKELRKQLWYRFISDIDWNMNLFVPMIAKKDSPWKRLMGVNKKITVNYYNLTPIDENPKFFDYFLRNYLCIPRPHNVIVPSLIIGINMKYTEIFLFGIDHNLLPYIVVDDNNTVLIEQKHFYSDQFKKDTLLADAPKPMYTESKKQNRKLHEVLQKFYFSFKSYWFIQEYAQFKNVNIYNLTKGSFVDAFERKSLE